MCLDDKNVEIVHCHAVRLHQPFDQQQHPIFVNYLELFLKIIIKTSERSFHLLFIPILNFLHQMISLLMITQQTSRIETLPTEGARKVQTSNVVPFYVTPYVHV